MNYREIWNQEYSTRQQDKATPPSPEEMARYKKVYSWYFKNWLPDNLKSSVLEIGCGSGMFLNLLKERGHSKVYGVDSSPQQVALAKEQGFDVVEANALEYLRDSSQSFYLIVALDFIEHLDRDEAIQFLTAACERLEPGGRLILQTPNGESPWVGSVFHGDLTHEVCYTPHLLEKLLRYAGFETIRYRPCGPPPIDFIASCRKLIWSGMTLVCKLLNRIEGAVSSGIYTRVFVISAIKPRQK